MDSLKKEVDLLNSIDFFMKNYAPFASKISFSRRRFVILDHIVRDIEFTVKINYDKYEFAHLISEYVKEIIKEIMENEELNYAGWNNSTVFIDESEVSEYFGYCFLNSSNVLKKKNVVSYRMRI